MLTKMNRKPSLSASIIESLKLGEMSSTLEAALLKSDRNYVNHKNETEYWDYKQDIYRCPKSVVSLGRYVPIDH